MQCLPNLISIPYKNDSLSSIKFAVSEKLTRYGRYIGFPFNKDIAFVEVNIWNILTIKLFPGSQSGNINDATNHYEFMDGIKNRTKCLKNKHNISASCDCIWYNRVWENLQTFLHPY